ncbi:MAG TPA: hypothetical protein VFI21_07025 [Nocardioides sp.]|jgi:hypothetical protein|nr:hypothetical protein [Nocardioides sp.]
MSTTQHRLLVGLLAAGPSGILLVPMAAPVQAAEVDLETQMHSTAALPRAGGYAEYESDRSGREFEIFISGVRSLHDKRLTVRVHGTFVGKMRVDQGGRAHMDRHSGVPKMVPGNVVRVRTPGGRLVSIGTLHRDTDD